MHRRQPPQPDGGLRVEHWPPHSADHGGGVTVTRGARRLTLHVRSPDRVEWDFSPGGQRSRVVSGSGVAWRDDRIVDESGSAAGFHAAVKSLGLTIDRVEDELRKATSLAGAP
jgi:hypothetical protein